MQCVELAPESLFVVGDGTSELCLADRSVLKASFLKNGHLDSGDSLHTPSQRCLLSDHRAYRDDSLSDRCRECPLRRE